MLWRTALILTGILATLGGGLVYIENRTETTAAAAQALTRAGAADYRAKRAAFLEHVNACLDDEKARDVYQALAELERVAVEDGKTPVWAKATKEIAFFQTVTDGRLARQKAELTRQLLWLTGALIAATAGYIALEQFRLRRFLRAAAGDAPAAGRTPTSGDPQRVVRELSAQCAELRAENAELTQRVYRANQQLMRLTLQRRLSDLGHRRRDSLNLYERVVLNQETEAPPNPPPADVPEPVPATPPTIAVGQPVTMELQPAPVTMELHAPPTIKKTPAPESGPAEPPPPPADVKPLREEPPKPKVGAGAGVVIPGLNTARALMQRRQGVLLIVEPRAGEIERLLSIQGKHAVESFYRGLTSILTADLCVPAEDIAFEEGAIYWHLTEIDDQMMLDDLQEILEREIVNHQWQGEKSVLTTVRINVRSRNLEE